MSSKFKTTVYLDPDDYRRLKEIARTDGRSPADQIREAIGEYVAKRRRRRLPASVGAGRSGRKDLSEKAEDILESLGRS